MNRHMVNTVDPGAKFLVQRIHRVNRISFGDFH